MIIPYNLLWITILHLYKYMEGLIEDKKVSTQ